jgi:TRAP-type C4-dicarboxylate transport system permease small subunit
MNRLNEQKEERTMNNLVVKIIGYVNEIVFCIAMALLFVGCALTVINSLFRKFLNMGFPGAEELATYSVVMMLFLSMPYLEQIDKHLCISILMSRLKNETAKRAVRIIRGCQTILIMCLLLRHGFTLAMRMYENHVVTNMLRMPRAPFFSAMLIGFAIIAAVWFCIAFVKKGRQFDEVID